jgi:hypothetical protein
MIDILWSIAAIVHLHHRDDYNLRGEPGRAPHASLVVAVPAMVGAAASRLSVEIRGPPGCYTERPRGAMSQRIQKIA